MSKEKEYFNHESAIIESSCEIGEGTRIWHFSHIMDGARIGTNCNIGQNVYIDRDAVIGNGCKIQNNVSVYKGVELEDEVFCGPSMVFTNVFNPRAFVERKDEFRKTLVKRGATLGANCTIVCGVTIGQYALIGAGSVVTRNVPAYALMYGVPAYQQGWACRCGVILPETRDELSCPECGTAYQLETSGQLQPIS